jgi:hypothetical protein
LSAQIFLLTVLSPCHWKSPFYVSTIYDDGKQHAGACNCSHQRAARQSFSNNKVAAHASSKLVWTHSGLFWRSLTVSFSASRLLFVLPPNPQKFPAIEADADAAVDC